jgi:hypothetical protein
MASRMRRAPSADGRADERRFPGDRPAEEARILYDELVRSRDRLADLPPLTPLDLEGVLQALHEVVWFMITPPVHASTPLTLPKESKATLLKAARNRGLDVYVIAVALIARKLAMRGTDNGLPAVQLDAIRDGLDVLTFDYRVPKRKTLTTLRDLRADVDARIAYVSAYRKAGYKFLEPPERYKQRKDKTERAYKFFQRVYASHVLRGLTQADIRHVDPAFYNVLHVWCTRHKRKLSSLVPATRGRQL